MTGIGSEVRCPSHFAENSVTIAHMDIPVFRSLESAKKLAMADGYAVIYDPRNQTLLNPTGATPLPDWPGVTAENGGVYEYAVSGGQISARPKLPQDHGLNLKPASNRELAEVLRTVVQMRDAIGPTLDFVLGGQRAL